MSNKISRRDVLKGLASVGLISLSRLEFAMAQMTTAPVRVLFVPVQHGWGISGGSNRGMSGTADDFLFPNGLDPFNAIRDQSVVVDGLLTLGHWGNNHDLSYADILTAGVPNQMESSAFESHMPLSVTPSIDYLLEQNSAKPAFRFSARYRSWGTAYHPMSFDGSSTVLPYYTSAYDAYNAFFAGLSNDPGSPEAEREAALVASVFHFIKKPAETDLSHLTPSERDKMERYLSAVGTLESKKASSNQAGSETLTVTPQNGQDSMTDIEHFLEMIKVGFANDMTRSAVLGIGDVHGISDFHHSHAHSNSNTWWDTRRDFAQHIVTFVNALQGITDFDGNTLLDNTIICLTGEVGDGEHNVAKKGHIVFGGGGGAIARGRWLQVANVDHSGLMREDINGVLQPQFEWGASQVGSRTNADLLREIGNMAGLSLSQFGLASQNKGSVLV